MTYKREKVKKEMEVLSMNSLDRLMIFLLILDIINVEEETYSEEMHFVPRYGIKLVRRFDYIYRAIYGRNQNLQNLQNLINLLEMSICLYSLILTITAFSALFPRRLSGYYCSEAAKKN